MKFKIEGNTDDTPVVLKLGYDSEGEPVIKANGVPVLYFLADGSIEFNSEDAADLKDMGFMIDSTNSVAISDK